MDFEPRSSRPPTLRSSLRRGSQGERNTNLIRGTHIRADPFPFWFTRLCRGPFGGIREWLDQRLLRRGHRAKRQHSDATKNACFRQLDSESFSPPLLRQIQEGSLDLPRTPIAHLERQPQVQGEADRGCVRCARSIAYLREPHWQIAFHEPADLVAGNRKLLLTSGVKPSEF